MLFKLFCWQPFESANQFTQPLLDMLKGNNTCLQFLHRRMWSNIIRINAYAGVWSVHSL